MKKEYVIKKLSQEQKVKCIEIINEGIKMHMDEGMTELEAFEALCVEFSYGIYGIKESLKEDGVKLYV